MPDACRYVLKRLLIFIALFTIAVIALIIYGLTPRDNPPALPTSIAQVQPSPTITNTPAPIRPTADPVIQDWQQRIEAELLNIDGVDVVEHVSVNLLADGLPFVSSDVIVYPGTISTTFADAYLQIVSQTLITSQFSMVSVIVSDGNQAVDYAFDFDLDEWRITPLTSVTPQTPRPQS